MNPSTFKSKEVIRYFLVYGNVPEQIKISEEQTYSYFYIKVSRRVARPVSVYGIIFKTTVDTAVEMIRFSLKGVLTHFTLCRFFNYSIPLDENVFLHK